MMIIVGAEIPEPWPLGIGPLGPPYWPYPPGTSVPYPLGPY